MTFLQAAKQELERQRRLEWERIRRQELLNQRNREQEEIVKLTSKKKSLNLELEALVRQKFAPHMLKYSILKYANLRIYINGPPGVSPCFA